MVKDDSKHVIDRQPGAGDDIGGSIELSGEVVATIAGLAVGDVPGIHSLGKSRLVNFKGGPTRGIAAEVGATEIALDVEVVIEHGCNIREVAGELRKRIAGEVEMMSGRKVVEINIQVVGVHVPETGTTRSTPRVR